MFILIQICACGLPSLSYLRNNNFNPVKVIDYYNGLLLLYHYNSVKFVKSYIICNSLTKEYVVLPSQAKRFDILLTTPYYAIWIALIDGTCLN